MDTEERIEIMGTKIESTGGSSSYYELPEGAKQLQDLIEAKDMNAQRKEVFKAAWRVGSKHGNNDVYDWNKIVYFGLRELGRIRERRDYITMAVEIIGDQSDPWVGANAVAFEKFNLLSSNILEALLTVPETLLPAQALYISMVLYERGLETCPHCKGMGEAPSLNTDYYVPCEHCKNETS